VKRKYFFVVLFLILAIFLSGCGGSGVTTPPITSNQSPTASFTANPTSGVAPLQVFFNASNSYDSDGTIISYAWDFKDGNIGSGETLNHIFSSIGSYNVLLTLTDDDGATDSTIKTITVASFQETISSLDTPEKLSDWMLKNIEYESHYEIWVETGIMYRATPEEIFESKCGCCAEFAIFACAVLEYHGYEAEIFCISVASDSSQGHAVCVYQSSNLLNIVNVGRIEGPYQTYQDIAFALNKDWTEYRIHDSWSTYQEQGYPDEVVYRE